MRAYLQSLHQDGHVGLGDAQRESKHGWDHDEADDQVQPDLHGPKDPNPEVLHVHVCFSSAALWLRCKVILV